MRGKKAKPRLAPGQELITLSSRPKTTAEAPTTKAIPSPILPQGRLELESICAMIQDVTKDTMFWLSAKASEEERVYVRAIQGRLGDLDGIITRRMQHRSSPKDEMDWPTTVREVLSLLAKATAVRGNTVGQSWARLRKIAEPSTSTAESKSMISAPPKAKAAESAVEGPHLKPPRSYGNGQLKAVRRRKKRKLNLREQQVLDVLKKGKVRGTVYCAALEIKKIPPRQEWIDGGCPLTYPEAYKIEKWRKRIQDEKYRLSRFLPKKIARNTSATRFTRPKRVNL